MWGAERLEEVGMRGSGMRGSVVCEGVGVWGAEGLDGVGVWWCCHL